MRVRWTATAMAIGALALCAAVSPSVAVAAFPGGNGLIAFSGSTGEPGPREIFTIRPDGSGLRQLTDVATVGTDATHPSWSADGRRLVFIRWVYTGEADDYAVLTIDAEGGDRTLVVNIGKSLVSPAPSFSPSGRRIVYAAVRPPPPRPVRGSIRTIRPDGTGPRKVLGGFLEEPQYSPNGKRIVFAGTPKGKNRSGIWDMRRDGSRLRRLTDPDRVDPELSDSDPDYSPDGRRIVFRREGFRSEEIRLMRADGSRERPLPDTLFAGSPAFAPAGDRIALPITTGLPGYAQFCSDIYTMSPTGSERQNVTNDCDPLGFGGAASTPSWQPDPASTLSFGKVKRNKKRGTAKLPVEVLGPGELELAKNKKLKGKQKSAESEGTVKLPIRPRRNAKKQLRREGKVTVRAKVTYTPDGGPPNTQSKKVGLKKKR